MSSPDPTTTPAPRPDDDVDRVIDLDEVVALLLDEGISAEVTQTGGAAPPSTPDRPARTPFEPDCLAFAAIAGPGRYGWGRRPSVAALIELVVGPDDSGETAPTEALQVAARDEATVARLIAEQVRHPERPATDSELAAAGFDPDPSRGIRRDRA